MRIDDKIIILTTWVSIAIWWNGHPYCCFESTTMCINIKYSHQCSLELHVWRNLLNQHAQHKLLLTRISFIWIWAYLYANITHIFPLEPAKQIRKSTKYHPFKNQILMGKHESSLKFFVIIQNYTIFFSGDNIIFHICRNTSVKEWLQV